VLGRTLVAGALVAAVAPAVALGGTVQIVSPATVDVRLRPELTVTVRGTAAPPVPPARTFTVARRVPTATGGSCPTLAEIYATTRIVRSIVVIPAAGRYSGRVLINALLPTGPGGAVRPLAPGFVRICAYLDEVTETDAAAVPEAQTSRVVRLIRTPSPRRR
jgi:hypothetical protein